MSVMLVVNLALFLVLVLLSVSVFTPGHGAIRLPKVGRQRRGARRLFLLATTGLMLCGTSAAQEKAQRAASPAAERAEATRSASATPVLTNAEILQMVKIGFAEETILKAIQLSETQFDLAVAALVEMKNAGVSEKVIQAMLHQKPAKSEEKPVSPAKNRSVPDDVGVFYVKNEALVDMRPELVGWRSGGVGKSLLLGTKGHINGAVRGTQSQNIVATPVEFIIRVPETLEIEEYQLLRLDVKPDRREFRALTGGFIHSSSGLDKNAMKFEFEKLAPRVYRVKLGNLLRGEYGFLPPGGSYGAIGGGATGAMIMQGTASAGKIYSFRVIE